MMQTAIVAALAGFALAEPAPSPGYVQFDLDARRPTGIRTDRAYRLQARDSSGTPSVDLDNDLTMYSVNVTIGTPGQKQVVQIDTGSSDLWVIASNNPYCATNNRELALATAGEGYIDCQATGTFNSNKSSSFNANNTEFMISYADFSFAKGEWGTDTVSFGSIDVKDASFAVASETNSTNPVFGIGLPSQESTADRRGGEYANIPQLMFEQGSISSWSYSLWLNDVNAMTGSLLFSGVDHDKYSGTLQLLPFVSDSGSGSPTSFAVMLSSISASTNTDGSNSATLMQSNLPVVLDSGTSFTVLPTQVVEAIGNALQAQFSEEIGFFLQSCDLQGSLTFSFNGLDLVVELSEFLVPLVASSTGGSGSGGSGGKGGQVATFSDGTPACAVALQASDEFFILGDNFLRSAYVVYDLKNMQAALAPAKFNQSSSNIEAIGSNGIPSASTAKGYSSTQMATAVSVNSNPGLSFSSITATGLRESNIPSEFGGGGLTATASRVGSDGASATGQAASGSSGSSGRASSSSSSSSSGHSSGAVAPLTPTVFVLALTMALGLMILV